MVNMLGVEDAWGSIPPGTGSHELLEGSRDVPVPAELYRTCGSSCHLAGSATQRSPERGFQSWDAFSVCLLVTQHWCCGAYGL